MWVWGTVFIYYRLNSLRHNMQKLPRYGPKHLRCKRWKVYPSMVTQSEVSSFVFQQTTQNSSGRGSSTGCSCRGRIGAGGAGRCSRMLKSATRFRSAPYRLMTWHHDRTMSCQATGNNNPGTSFSAIAKKLKLIYGHSVNCRAGCFKLKHFEIFLGHLFTSVTQR